MGGYQMARLVERAICRTAGEGFYGSGDSVTSMTPVHPPTEKHSTVKTAQ